MKLLIDTEWFEVIKDLSVEKQQEVLNAILNYPNGHSDTNIWNKVIFPALEKGRIGYFNKISKLKQFNKPVTDTDTVADTDTRTARREEYNINNNNSRINTSSLSTTHEAPTCEQVLEYAKQQDDMAGVGGFAVSQEQAQDFYDYYSGIGWVVPNDAKTPIVDWKPFLRKWVRNPRFKTKEPDKIDINDPEHFII